MHEQLERGREALGRARRVLVLTGAGVSAESGVPTFRGPEGLWRNFDPTQLATPAAFARDPKLVWEWYDWRRGIVAKCLPNTAHHALVQLEARAPEFLLVTQNVDGLHAAAGSHRMVELHGSIWKLRTTTGPLREWEDRTVPLDPLPPVDDRGNLLRPAVLWYGEILPQRHLDHVEEFIADGVDVALIVGTTALIGYIQYFIQALSSRGAFLIEINPERSQVSGIMDIFLEGRAGEILSLVVE